MPAGSDGQLGLRAAPARPATAQDAVAVAGGQRRRRARTHLLYRRQRAAVQGEFTTLGLLAATARSAVAQDAAAMAAASVAGNN